MMQLRFLTGAVTQHDPKTLARQPGRVAERDQHSAGEHVRHANAGANSLPIGNNRNFDSSNDAANLIARFLRGLNVAFNWTWPRSAWSPRRPC